MKVNRGIRARGTAALLGSLIGLTCLVCPAIGEDVAWEVDVDTSRVAFTVSHLGIGEVEGTFDEFSAKVKADRETGRLGSVTASVRTGSIDTGIAARDRDLRSAELFNVEEHPQMTLRTGKIHWDGDKFSGWAKLTIKGDTEPVKYSGELVRLREVSSSGEETLRAEYRVSAEIDRKVFGLEFGGFSEGLGMVGDTVTIRLKVEAVRR